MAVTALIIELGLRISGTKFGDFTQIPIHWIVRDDSWSVDPDFIYVERAVQADIARVASSSSTLPLILALGDSFTAGAPFLRENSSFNQMQRSLADEFIFTELLNTGTSGYNPDQELIMLKKILEKGIRPKLVIWSFYTNDFPESGQWPNFSLDENGQLLQLSGANNFIFQRQLFFDALPLPKIIKHNSSLVAAMLHFFNLKIDREIPREFRDRDSNFDWVNQKFKLEIQEAKQLAKQYDFTLVFVSIYPQTNYFSPEFLAEQGVADDQTKEVDAFTQLLSQEEHYIPLQLNTLLENGDYSLQPPQCVDGATRYFTAQGSPEDDFPVGQHHFNQLGYFLFGEIVKQTVQPLLSLPSN